MTDISSSAQTEDLITKPDVTKRAVKIYTRYERFWHWSQALLIFILAFSGFNLHGTPFSGALPSCGNGTHIRRFVAVAIVAFHHILEFHHWTMAPLSTAEQGAVRSHQILCLWHHHGGSASLCQEPQPQAKRSAVSGLSDLHGHHRPSLVAVGHCLSLVWPLESIENGQQIFSLVAFVHTAAAFAMITFVVIHVYMTTTGKTVFHYIKTMITGYEKIELTPAEEAYLEEQQPGLLKDTKS